MNFNRKQLTNAVKAVSKAVSKRSAHPALGCVLLKWDSVSGTNLDTWVKVELDGSCMGNYQPICINAKQLLAVLASSKQEPVVISTYDGKTTVDGMQVDSVNPADYPDMPPIDYNGGKRVTISGKQLDSVINQVAWTAATYDSSSVLGGVFFEGTTVASTDGSRLSCVNNVPFAGTGVSTMSAVVNASVLSKVIQPLVKLTAKASKSVTMIHSEDKKTLSFSATGWTVITRLIDSAYPRYEYLFPVASVDSTINFNRIETLTALAKLKPFLNKITSAVKVDVTNCKISIDDHEVVINAHLANGLAGQQVGWSCSYNFLVEVLESFETAYVCMQYDGPLKPLVFNPRGDYRHLLMPRAPREVAKAKAA